MLAATITESDLPKLSYPIYAQYKYDGVRCKIYKGIAYSRTLKRIPNKFVQKSIASGFRVSEDCFDGELIYPGRYNFNEVQSAVMSVEGEPVNIRLAMFDRELAGCPERNFESRWDWVMTAYASGTYQSLFFPVITELLHSPKEVLEFEDHAINTGYEGIILRSPTGIYKHGRSTKREQYLLKLKRVADCEGIILKVFEAEHNGNIATKDERGYAKRSSHAENKYSSGMIGSFEVEIINGEFKGVITRVGRGNLTHAEATKLWPRRTELLNQTITFKYVKNRKIKDKPLESRFKCFRKDI